MVYFFQEQFKRIVLADKVCKEILKGIEKQVYLVKVQWRI